jgi:branched-chain amino acid transport system substrate-binding protein
MKRIVPPVLARVKLGFLALVVLSCTRPDVRSTAADIHVAANVPLTGALATYGVAIREGATLALEDGGQPPIKVDWQDNASDPKTAVTILQSQLRINPDIYISGVKPQTMAITAQLSQSQIPHFEWIFDARINNGTTNNFRTWVSYKIEPAIYYDYIAKQQARRVAITYVQLPHTVDEFERIIIPGLHSRDIVVMSEPYDFGRSDFADIATKIARFKPDLIILNGFQSDLVGLVRSLRPLGAIHDGNTIATYDLLDAAKVLDKDELEGLRLVAPKFETRPASDSVASFRERFRRKFNREPLYTHAFAYDMITAIRAAASGLRLPATRQQWIGALRKVDAVGITGPIRFDADGDMVTPLEVGVFRGGRLFPDSLKH